MKAYVLETPRTLLRGVSLSKPIPRSPSAQYISASRRTDLPRFQYEEFFAAWRKGEITYDGGYGRSYTVSLKQDDVLGYIFWSKDFAPFIAHPDFTHLISQNNAVFQFTLNDCAVLEPNVPPVRERIDTMKKLCDMAGCERVVWRYDPLCRYVDTAGQTCDNTRSYHELLPLVHSRGVREIIFSFMTSYNKLRNRPVSFVPFENEERQRIAMNMWKAANKLGMNLSNCCNQDIPELVPQIKQAHCVDENLLKRTDRFGVHKALKPAPSREGCGCYKSRDIGSYSPACPHGCVYCYANPEIGAME